jgi:indolepyruvate ferredoxin oxidoreductase beta subunit
MEYPKEVEQTFRKYFKENVWVVNGLEMAKNLGNVQVANVVLIGTFSNFLQDLNPEQWVNAIKDLLPAKLHEINIRAFHEGRMVLSGRME